MILESWRDEAGKHGMILVMEKAGKHEMILRTDRELMLESKG
jgi:hypothetical protein